MARRFQTGSVVGFTIIAFILLALLIGVVSLVRNAHNAADTRGAEPTKDQQLAKDNTDKVDEDKLRKALEDQPTDSKTPATDKSTAPAAGGSTDSTKKPDVSSDSAKHLPETGPTEDILSGLGIAILLGSIIAFGRSRL